MSQHFIRKCVCGITLAQCRCPDPNKAVKIVEPCTHDNLMSQLSTDIRMRCRVYSGDTDGFRVSMHRLEDYINSQDKAILSEVQALREELAEQQPLLAALLKQAKKVQPE